MSKLYKYFINGQVIKENVVTIDYKICIWNIYKYIYHRTRLRLIDWKLNMSGIWDISENIRNLPQILKYHLDKKYNYAFFKSKNRYLRVNILSYIKYTKIVSK